MNLTACTEPQCLYKGALVDIIMVLHKLTFIIAVHKPGFILDFHNLEFSRALHNLGFIMDLHHVDLIMALHNLEFIVYLINWY